jgi:hypothetical protein
LGTSLRLCNIFVSREDGSSQNSHLYLVWNDHLGGEGIQQLEKVLLEELAEQIRGVWDVNSFKKRDLASSLAHHSAGAPTQNIITWQ